MQRNAEGVAWGRSPALGLDLCWYTGRLRFYDPTAGAYRRNLAEAEAVILLEQAARRDAEARANAEAAARRDAEARANAEAVARRDAEAAQEADQARIRQLEEELRRRQSNS